MQQQTATGTGWPPTTAAASVGYNPMGVLRVLLAVLVLVQHAGTNVAPPWLRDAIGPYEVGTLAVYVFFVLSGYIIADAVQATYVRRPFAFIANRLLRIVPSYVVALAVFGLGAAALIALGHSPLPVDGQSVTLEHLLSPTVWVANLVAIVPLVPHHVFGADVPLLIPVVWAVRIEFLFYGVYFLLLLTATLARRPLGPVLAVAGVAALAYSILWFDDLTGKALENIPLFVIGVAAHRLIAGDRRLSLGSATAGLLLAVALATAVLRLWWRDPVFGPLAMPRDIPAEIALFLAMLVLFGWLASVRCNPKGRLVAIDRRIGEFTYPIYLNHMIVLVAVEATASAFTLATFLVTCFGSIVVSCLIAMPTEPLISRLRNRVRGRRLD